jgi:hypothetical protein
MVYRRTEVGQPMPRRTRELLLVSLLLVAAALQFAWNAWQVPPLTGYDGAGHAAYIYTVAEEGRLPHPTEGWSTFHPPLYYLLAAVVWSTAEPHGSKALVAALRGIGALALLAAALAGYFALRRASGSASIAWVGTALFLFVPCVQMAGTMMGNEALNAALATFALLAILRLQEDPRRVGAALSAGLLTGLALDTKFTSIWVACALGVTIFQLRRATWRPLLVATATAAAVAAPVYARNLLLCGTPFPMTREIEPMRSIEQAFVLRPRRIGDYLYLSPTCFSCPSIYAATEQSLARGERNPMRSVWGLAYASTWSDAFNHRVEIEAHRAGIWPLGALCLLGLVPTAVAFSGFLSALWRTVRHGPRAPEAPLVVMGIAALATFIAFTWKAPAVVAVKGAYFLPLVLPAALWFARGLTLVPARAGRVLLVLSFAAALLAAITFTTGLVLDPLPRGTTIASWLCLGQDYPALRFVEAVRICTRDP